MRLRVGQVVLLNGYRMTSSESEREIAYFLKVCKDFRILQEKVEEKEASIDKDKKGKIFIFLDS